MVAAGFSPGFILKTLFRHTMQNQRYFADYYLYCDRTLVYKWINDKVVLPKKHIPVIVRFVLEQTRPAEQLQIRCDIEAILSLSSLSEQSKTALTLTNNFSEFICSTLLQAIQLRQAGQQDIVIQAHDIEMQALNLNLEPKGADIQSKSIDVQPLSTDIQLHDSLSQSQDTALQQQQSIAVQISHRTGIGIHIILCGFLASATGGILWSLLNHLFGLQHYMGGSGNEPSGSLSVIWGILASAPIIICALISAAKDSAELITTKEKAFLIVFYSLLGGIGAFIFYNSKCRILIERLDLAYGFQEAIIAALYALILSAFPLITLVILLRRFHTPLWFIPAGALVCVAVAALAAFGTWTVNRPEAEVAQLRGFTVALALRLCIFIVTYLHLSDRLQLRRQAVYDTSAGLHGKTP